MTFTEFQTERIKEHKDCIYEECLCIPLDDEDFCRLCHLGVPSKDVKVFQYMKKIHKQWLEA